MLCTERKKVAILVTVIVTIFFPPKLAMAQTGIGGKSKISLGTLMKASEFEACGLNKLSVKELTNLGAWLQSYVLQVTKTASPAVIESHIEGEFNGWEGETVFVLDNGQIWQQASYSFHYHYAFRPEVLIYKTSGGYNMKVDGVDKTIMVRLLK